MKHLYIFLLFFSYQTFAQSSLTVSKLTVEHQQNPIALGEAIPRFSWKLASTERGITQKNYQITVATDDKFTKKNISWATGEVASEASVLIEYQGSKLQSRKRYFWKVAVTDNIGNKAESAVQFFEMGLTPADWQAKWIEPEKEIDTKKQQPSPLLRKTFNTAKPKITSARLYVTSRGLHEVEINGQRVGDAVLAPGWTAYQQRFQYHTYDVTSLIKPGANAIAAMLGDGWYRGTLAWDDNRNLYGQKLALLAQLVVKFADGSEQIIITDESWKTNNNGPIRENELYHGENYDARMELSGWSLSGFDDTKWWNAKVIDYQKDNLTSVLVPVRKIEEIKPVKIFKTPAGETVVDFGQNMVGWVKLKVNGPAGTTITVNHAEVLDQKGNFYTANLRRARCELKYTLKGGGEEVYEPRFTFMGFQFAKITGWPGELTTDNIVGVVIHSDMPTAGEFTSSKPLVNQLQHNIVWGQKGNFVDVPTDCPQRDERLGWTGDAQAFVRTATFNYNVAGFFNKWLKDVAIDQKPNGAVPFVVPDVLRNGTASSGWADVATIAPWTIYQVYGDRRILENQYESMKKWVAYMKKEAGMANLWQSGFHFGDWLSYRGSDSPAGGESVTDNDFIASAFYAHSVKLTSQTALALGKGVEAIQYSELHDKIKEAFNREFVTTTGRLVCNTQTAYVLALNFDLLPENLRQQAVDKLVKNIEEHKDHLTTGFLGTPYLCEVLSRFGRSDVAYRLLNQESYPSWLYPVKKGATTIWERWDGIKPDGSFQDMTMNSFNHYAYGAIGDWMYQRMAGINFTKIGFKEISIAPIFGGGFTSVAATYECPYGKITSAWQIIDGKKTLKVTIPANTKAKITVPNAKIEDIKESEQPLNTIKHIKILETVGPDVTLEAGSGNYIFVW
jgi:alpha-L-rhamnosidase